MEAMYCIDLQMSLWEGGCERVLQQGERLCVIFMMLDIFCFRFVKIINSFPKLETDITVYNTLERANTAEFITNKGTTFIPLQTSVTLILHQKNNTNYRYETNYRAVCKTKDSSCYKCQKGRIVVGLVVFGKAMNDCCYRESRTRHHHREIGTAY